MSPFARSGYWFAALLGLTVLAFWPSYFARLPGGPSTYMHAHAAVMLLWMLLLVIQPLLIRARRNDLHRRIGRVAFVLAPLAVATALLLSHSRIAPLGAAEFEEAAPFVYLPLQATALFALTAGLALLYRRSTTTCTTR